MQRESAALRRLAGIGDAVVVALLVVWTLGPLVWLILTSLKTDLQVSETPVRFLPHPLTWENYAYVVRDIGPYMVNSAIAAVGGSFVALVVGGLAAYGLSRFGYPPRLESGLRFAILATRMIIPVVFVIPLYVLFQFYGLFNTRTGLVVAYTMANLPFVVWMMETFFAEVPRELEEAAWMDGASRGRALWSVVLPVSAGGVAATAILSLVFSWNDLVFGLFLTSSASAMTVPAVIANFVSQYRTYWAHMAAAGTVAIVPMIVLASVVQRYIVRGLTMGSIR